MNLSEVAQYLRDLAAETRKRGEAKEIESDEWDAIDEGLANYEMVAGNIDALIEIIQLTNNYIDGFEDLK